MQNDTVQQLEFYKKESNKSNEWKDDEKNILYNNNNKNNEK